MKTLKSIVILFTALFSLNVYSQELDANLQIRPRYEYRNGFKNLLPLDESPTSFISQRSRLNFNFKQDKLTTKLSLQNVRVWGDISTTAQADKNGVAVFEAWAQYSLSSKWNARMGRQLLSYDNQRIFGGIDWIQQGQSHDALVFLYNDSKHKLDLGLAINSNAENLIETIYTVPNYKSMQYGHYSTKWKKLNLSVLFLNVGFEYLDVNDDIAVDYNQTFGSVVTYKESKFEANLNAYGQSGKRNDKNITAFNMDLNISYALTSKWKTTLGHEYLSGKHQNDTDSKIKSFNPLFGTNHAHNGLMDYFYVGNHINSVGLNDTYLKFAYNNNKWQFMAVPHIFNSAANVLNTNNKVMDNYLGTEVDLTFDYKLQKDITISGGYSQMFASKTLERLKGGDSNKTNNWAWLMVNINPRIFSSKQ